MLGELIHENALMVFTFVVHHDSFNKKGTLYSVWFLCIDSFTCLAFGPTPNNGR